jgi:hypothetical protein
MRAQYQSSRGHARDSQQTVCCFTDSARQDTRTHIERVVHEMEGKRTHFAWWVHHGCSAPCGCVLPFAGNCLAVWVVEAVSAPFSFGGVDESPVASCATPLLEAPAAAALCEVRTLRRFALVSRGGWWVHRIRHLCWLWAHTAVGCFDTN